MLDKHYLPISEVQSDLLLLLKEFDRICRKNGIKYTLDGGTMLGAFRHDGFIPWDDDADVAMLRKEYRKFIKCAKKDLNNNLFIIEEVGKPKTYSYNFAKLKLKGTYFCEPETAKVVENHGIWIDIFPMDNTFGCLYKVQSKFASFFQTIKWAKNGRDYKTNHPKLVSFFSRVLPYWFINTSINYHLCCFDFLPTKNVCKLCHFGKNKNPHSRNYYLQLDEHLFCNSKFFVMKEAVQWLRLRYGEWEKLPPESERHPEHGFKVS